MTRAGPGLTKGLKAAGLFVCAATLLPMLKAQSWWVRAFDFPRVQIASLGAVTLTAAWRLNHSRRRPTGWSMAVGAAVVIQAIHILKYTRLAPRQVVRRTRPAPGSCVSLLVCNVRMKNRAADQLLELVETRDPDLVMLLEPNEWWLRRLALHKKYRWRVEVPQENTYGMALYSRLELLEPEVRHLVQRDVPSFRTRVRTRDGQVFWLHQVHPRPPVRGNLEGDIEFPGSGKRDAELVRVALEVASRKEPCLVTGDFNDVAWSHTTRHFQRVGRLLDPRVGRGMYNTFNAEHWWLRFPLDHLFHSREFAVVDFERGPYVGSDHFPLLATLALQPVTGQEPPPRQPGDLKEAAEKVAAGSQAQ